MDQDVWDTKTLDDRNKIVSDIEFQAAERVRWFYGCAEEMRKRGESSRKQQDRIWLSIVLLNALIAVMNILSLIPPIDKHVETWVFPAASVLASILIATIGLMRDSRKYGQIASLCDSFYNELMSVETWYQTAYMIDVRPYKPEYKSLVEMEKLFHGLGEKRNHLAEKISKEFSVVGEKRDPAITPTS